MVARRQIHQAIHSRMRSRSNTDEDSFQWEHIVQTLANELRHEVSSFFGNDGSDLEKAYPGFDYMDEKTRVRLSRWPWHRSFFKAIDYLGLSDSEIDSVVTWWGTLKERRAYEARTGIIVKDTTGDDIPTWEEVQEAQRAERRRQDEALLRQQLYPYGIQEEVESMLRDARCTTASATAMQASLQEAILQSETAAAVMGLQRFRQLPVEPVFGSARPRV